MPARARTRPAAAPEPATEEAGYTDFLTKDYTTTMEDYIEWFETYVSEFKGIPADRLLVLGVQLYSDFQKSQFRIDRREQRRADREQAAAARAAAAPAETAEPAAPARTRGRKPAAAAAAPEGNGQPARPTRGRRAKSVSAAY